jgi:Zn-dependent peptidase ImmA (M78 family)/transcriptional regulator with XRE-family HTH domain
MNRIKQLRLARGLSLDDLVEAMGGMVTKQAISKYERELSRPSAPVANELARVLKVKSVELWAEPEVTIDFVAYRRRSTLQKKQQATVEALVQRELEERFTLQQYCCGSIELDLPIKALTVDSEGQAEDAAAELREKWKLGVDPIANLTAILEDHLVHVIEIESSDRFDGISAIAKDETGTCRAAAVVTRSGCPGERQRLNLSHELGHVVMKVADNVDVEKAAFRFAGSFMAPEKCLTREVGTKRTSVELEELLILKRRFGISMQALLRRLSDLEVITSSHYKWWCIFISKMKWRKQEPSQLAPEKSEWVKQAALRSYTEGFITVDEANTFAAQEIVQKDGPSSLRRKAFLNLPMEERNRILEEQAEQMRAHYKQDQDWREIQGGDVID